MTARRFESYPRQLPEVTRALSPSNSTTTRSCCRESRGACLTSWDSAPARRYRLDSPSKTTSAETSPAGISERRADAACDSSLALGSALTTGAAEGPLLAAASEPEAETSVLGLGRAARRSHAQTRVSAAPSKDRPRAAPLDKPQK